MQGGERSRRRQQQERQEPSGSAPRPLTKMPLRRLMEVITSARMRVAVMPVEELLDPET